MSDRVKQQVFIDKITDKKAALKGEETPIQLYKELVHHRFFEVISNANPIFFSHVDTQILKDVITKFIQYGAKNELIWKLPNEFRAYVKKEKKHFKHMPYINDLLWFEWIEIELFMQDYSAQKISKFNWDKFFKISKCARIKKLSYQVYLKKFNTKGKFFVLVYYDVTAQAVIYRELSSFMYEYLVLLKTQSLKKALKTITEKYRLKTKEVKALLEKPLKELCALGVLKRKD
ncbi:MAG: hypothetical protein ACNI3C_03625 [Candidatus Marinarcus sp.]|uniref:hypothetical protein n=1 Tax=Candidatus Marinarcus sp. TaxID=3100987 RepID=UPI003AFF9926